MKEGHYTLNFAENVAIDQFYFNAGRRQVKTTTRSSWCSSNKSPLKINDSKGIEGKNSSHSWTSWRIEEQDLNKEFRFCIDFHRDKHYHTTNISKQEDLDTSIICEIQKCVVTHATECRKLKFESDTSRSCKYIWNDLQRQDSLRMQSISDGSRATHQEINLPHLNISQSDIMIDLVCFIHDAKETFGNKYAFVQPIVIEKSTESSSKPPPTTESLRDTTWVHTTEAPSIVTEEATESSSKAPPTSESPNQITSANTNMTIVIILCVFVLIGISFTSFWYYRKMQVKHKLPDNNDDTSNTDDNRIDDHDDTGDEKMDFHILPAWLSIKCDMIYPPCCVESGAALGHGQYGTVYKGTLTQGNAV